MVILNCMLNNFSITKFRIIQSPRYVFRYCCTYVQGQSPEHRVREYFYFIDHQGMLFLDDTKIKNFTSCFKDKKFLAFFFKRLRLNNTDRYKDFPYLSLCGRERNYVKCDDLPIVFTQVLQKENVETGKKEDYFSYNHAHELLMIPFEPNKIFMSVHSGRVYHPAPEVIGGIGLVKSSLAIEFSSHFYFENGAENGPTQFNWQGKEYKLDCEWYKLKI
ncbi:PREDICTED: UPF0598 protein CG30010 [Ceratosolen solmsi marchali]|uniref:UPF0598 protein CG30010 n=1 Tax=Ceratosolen solmsi marchali TaxID=326594 RepID=A0AAJ6YNY7_9HYME|nr:PREDICTED: UPF0598 protein CG30010 [Ceratosolen solmsi marchali]